MFIGDYEIGKNEFLCPTCGQEISVQHIVWFVKHLKFCGKDDVRALDILTPGISFKYLVLSVANFKTLRRLEDVINVAMIG